jgi:Methylamine utilization protein MauJ
MRLECAHPAGTYRVFLEDKDVTPGVETPLLNAFIVFEGEDDPANARKVGRAHLREFIETVTLAVGLRLRVHREVCFNDWTTGNPEHYSETYDTYPDQSFPVRVLDSGIMAGVSALLERDRDDPIRRALRWYSLGVNASTPDEQFEWFWLAIEVLADRTKDVTRVPDLCPICKDPLFCHKCNETPTHRPYSSQAIRELIQTHAEEDPVRLSEVSSEFRHALTHGRRLQLVEDEQGVKITEVVDAIGCVAWRVLTSFVIPTTATHDRPIAFLIPSTFLHRRLTLKTVGSFGSPIDREPQLEDIPVIEITLHREPDVPPTPPPAEQG